MNDMSGEEIIPVSKQAAKGAKKALGESEHVKQQLAEMAKDSPAMQAAAESYARRIQIKQGILTKIYEPLAKWAGASWAYFESQFPEEMAERIADKPDECLTSPHPSVAVPAIQGLGYSLEDPDLKEMYLQLLATATDNRVSERAHPSFAEIIKQLSPQEAAMLANVLRNGNTPIARLKKKAVEGKGGTHVASHLLPLQDEDSGAPVEEPSLPVWIDNWNRLGLVRIDYVHSFVEDARYQWIEGRPELVRLSAEDDRGREGFEVERGILFITDFGCRFSEAVLPPPEEDPPPTRD